MAIFGWMALKQAEIYTKAAEQKRLARSGMHHLVPETDSEVVALLPQKSPPGIALALSGA